MTTFEYSSSKLGNVKSETRSIAREVFDAAQRAGHDIWFMWGMGDGTEHGSGLALDLMVKNEAAGDWIRDYIWANRERLRLRHVIWEQHITSTVTKPGERRLMADRGSTTENHYDHNHVWLFAGAYRAPGGSTTPPPPPVSGGKSIGVIAAEVIRGLWGNNPERANHLSSFGYNPDVVQAEVNRQLGAPAPRPVPTPPPRKSVNEIAKEVLAGWWGNGDDRVNRLRNKGYDPNAVQTEVNRLVSGGKSVTQIAKEVIAGKWGNNPERIKKLTDNGYNASAVQAEVNRLLR